MACTLRPSVQDANSKRRKARQRERNARAEQERVKAAAASAMLEMSAANAAQDQAQAHLIGNIMIRRLRACAIPILRALRPHAALVEQLSHENLELQRTVDTQVREQEARAASSDLMKLAEFHGDDARVAGLLSRYSSLDSMSSSENATIQGKRTNQDMRRFVRTVLERTMDTMEDGDPEKRELVASEMQAILDTRMERPPTHELEKDVDFLFGVAQDVRNAWQAYKASGDRIRATEMLSFLVRENGSVGQAQLRAFGSKDDVPIEIGARVRYTPPGKSSLFVCSTRDHVEAYHTPFGIDSCDVM